MEPRSASAYPTGVEIVLLTIACAFFYSIFAVSARLAGGNIDEWLASVFYNGVGMAVPLVVYFSSEVKGRATTRGLFFATLAGVAIMLFSVVLGRIYNRGGHLAFVVPTLYGIAIVSTSIFGWLALKEKVSALSGMGVALIVAGIACVVTARLQAR